MSLVGAFTTVVRSTVITIALLIFGASSSMAAPQVVPYEQFMDTSLYPARVIAISFAGNTLQSGSNVKWGAWEARMTAKPVVAKLSEVSPGSGQWSLLLEGLVCANAVEGEKSCVLGHYKGPEISTSCMLTLMGDGAAVNASFPVVCPVSLTLDY